MSKALPALEALLKAVADTTRLRIVQLLAAGEVCVCHIHESLRIPQPKASRHLAYLRRAGIVETRRNGLWVYYRLAELDDPVLAAILQAVRHAVGHLGHTGKDMQRLEKLTGCCAPPAIDVPEFSCCAGSLHPTPAASVLRPGEQARPSLASDVRASAEQA